MFILPVMKDHLSWEITKFSGRYIQVSLHIDGFVHACHISSANALEIPVL